MTTKTRPCALCRTRPRLYFVTSQDLCQECYDYAGWENTHSDDDHDGVSAGYGVDSPVALDSIKTTMSACPICLGVPAPWTVTEEPKMSKTAAAKPRTNPTTRHMSHASCSHPRTPAGRAACRKAIRAPKAPETTPAHVRVGKSKTVHAPGACLTVQRHDGAIERTDDAVTCKNCLKIAATVDA